MGQEFDHISLSEQAFIRAQSLFFCATAAPGGRVNISPKGLDSLRILDSNRLIWLNLTGSGNETAAHILQNPRMTLMFCAFQGDAKILRIYGTAKMIQPNDKDWEILAEHFPDYPGPRQIYDMTVDLVKTSCGMGVPLFSFDDVRGEKELTPYLEKMGPERLAAYQKKKNTLSIDGFETGLPTQE